MNLFWLIYMHVLQHIDFKLLMYLYGKIYILEIVYTINKRQSQINRQNIN